MAKGGGMFWPHDKQPTKYIKSLKHATFIETWVVSQT